MNRWVVEPMQRIADRLIAVIADFSGYWINIFTTLLAIVFVAAIFAFVFWRLARRFQIQMDELKGEIDQLRIAEERRILAELKSNEAFLEKLENSPIMPQATHSAKPTGSNIHTAPFKKPSVG